MARWLVGVNRAAGRKSVEPSAVRDVLTRLGVDHELVVPGSVDEMGRALKESASAGYTHFALAGGDGTMNLAVNSLFPLDLETKPVIAMLPVGTGCDLLKTFGMPQDLSGAAKHLTTEDTYDIDIGVLEGDWGTRYFANVAQAGVGAAAAETAPKVSRRFGAVRYPLAFGARLPRFPRARIKLVTEKRSIEAEGLAVILANAQFFAGGWNVAPKATLVDGVLDVQIFDVKKSQAPALVPKIIKGTHLSDPGVRRLKAAEIVLETEPNWPVEADGDLIGNTTVRARVVPAAVRLKI